MKPRASLLVVFPGIVTGMLLAVVAMELSDAAFPATMERVFSPQIVFALALAAGAAGVVGLVSLPFTPRDRSASEEFPHRPTNPSDHVRPGGPHAQ